MAPEPTAPRGRKRPLTTDDLLELEELGEVALSPDGRWLAYVVKRPRLTATFHKYDFLDGGDRGDVWLVETSGGVPRNLTEGAADGSGWWAPNWSPDSRRLAMLSTKGGNIFLWGCDIPSGDLARLCERPVDIDAFGGAPNIWVGSENLLVPTLPEGERSQRMTVEIQAAEKAMREWPRAWSGKEPTASALDSGSHAPFEDRLQGELRLVDAASGREETVMNGFFRNLRISPDRRHVAFFRQVDVIRPEAARTLEHGGGTQRLRLGIVTVGGAVVGGAVEGIEGPVRTSLRWSPDSTAVGLIARDERLPESPRVVFCYRLSDGRLESLSDATLEPTSAVWTADGEMLALAKPAQRSGKEGRRPDWWLLRGDDAPRNLSADLSAVPNQLFREEERGTLVGLAGGDILRLSVEDCSWANLTAAFAPKITWLVWPAPNASDGESFAQLVLAVDEGSSTGWYSLDLRSGELSSLSWPTAKGWLLAFAPENATAVQVAVDRSGARLWVSKPAFKEHRAALETNTWLCDIAQGEIRRIDYRGLDGDELRGWLIMPVDHEPGRCYPLVTRVYPGAVYTSETPPMRILSIGAHHALDYQLLPARGYAVLLPSMPLKPERESSDPYMELTKGVLPAVDQAIELGVADPDRLALIGQSYGGYGTYGLITQTRRFRAAVALAGFADLVSLYGEFDPRFRYGERPHEHFFQISLAESGQNRMGGPPWKDAQRYVRNSPLFSADRVETPLLILQGDMDYVPLQQGEQFFSALYRQGKRARFVRYWGEGHVFQSPANIRHMWEEIYSWFDEFLKPLVSSDTSDP